ncbi:MAG: EAL domain-containing protein [Sulfurospirillum sp.]|nr:EAL domain-containing protein [Sulfurospirillum sp.]
MHINKDKIIRWIVALPLLAVALTTTLIMVMFIKLEQDSYTQQIENLQRDYLKKTKIQAQERVDHMADYLRESEKILRQEAQLEVKNITNLALNIITQVHQDNIDLPREIVLAKIKERLRGIRFFENFSGYFFVYDFDGTNVLLPTQVAFEGANMLHIKDSQGAFIVQDFIKIAKEKNADFYDWYWFKPSDAMMRKKIGYIAAYKPLEILVGTARYEEDIIASIKKSAKIYLENMSHLEDGGIFAYDGSGKLMATQKDAEQVQKSASQVSQIIRGSQIMPDGFFISHTTSMQFDTGSALAFNSSFVRYIQSFDWVVGVDTYGSKVKEVIAHQAQEIKTKRNKSLYNMSIVFFSVALLVFFVMFFISKRLKNIFDFYQKKLLLRHNKTKEQKKLLRYQANHDILTNLPNRGLLSERLAQLLKRAKREKYQVAVVFVDVDKFKMINDTHGHKVGDMLLQKIATKLKNAIRETDIAARLSGDEFIIVIDRCFDLADITTVLAKIKEYFEEPLSLETLKQSVKLSMGVSVYPQDGESGEMLMQKADTAMFKAKEEGRNNYKFFIPEMDTAAQAQQQLEKELKEALANEEFLLYYQPIVNSKSLHVEGFEALIRWNHPQRGIVEPNEFIMVAEESDLIIEIGDWVNKEAMRQVAYWYSLGLNPGRISINFAGKQLEQEGLFERIVELFAQTGCKPEWIGIEVVERFVMKNPQKSIALLQRFRELNIGVSIDDFGTGYSSLSYLRVLPITKLKIDRAFVKDIIQNHEDRAIAKTIIALANGLFLKSLAEGIETTEQRDFFIQNGCTQMQGYLFGKPLEAQAALQMLVQIP